MQLQKSTDRPIPWPSIHKLDGLNGTENTPVRVPLQEQYTIADMAYLDTPEAYPLFEKQARIIKNKKYTGIIDVGCRTGIVNDILHEDGFKYYDYNYFGFDTSSEPIHKAQKTYANCDHINFAVQSWIVPVKVDFEVDVMIFSGVLLYIKNDLKREEFFKNQMAQHNCKNAIIQEPYHFQRHWDDRLILNTITNGGLDFLNKDYKVDEHYLDLPIFAGKRVLYDVSSRT